MTWWVHQEYRSGGLVAVLSWAFWVIFSITLHELGHGWAAIRQGDDTPRRLGRMTLNPLVHMGVPSLVMFALIGIAWGAIATDGPIGVTAGRAWHQLSGLWCELVQLGADPVLLRRQSLITPHCGLGTHSPAVAERICRMVRDISGRVRDQATAARFVLGA